MHSTRYVIIFILVLTSVVAAGITFIREVTKEQAELNEAIFKKRDLLKSVQPILTAQVDDLGDEEVLDLFESKVEQIVVDHNGEVVSQEDVIAKGYKGGKAEHIDMAKEKKKPVSDRLFPVFVYKDADKKAYILSVIGTGLWDAIWASIAIDSDLTTVVGATFDHKAETPGLGAEIKDNKSWAKQFQGKKLTNEAGDYVYVTVRKGGAQNQRTEVDGITGATVTCDGVNDMIEEGMGLYQPYLKTL